MIFTPIKGCLSPALFAYRYLGLELYPWQAETVEACAREHAAVALVAANGSGKTAAVNATLLLWWLYAYPRGRAAVTSGSWEQLESQLWPALMSYAHVFTPLLGWQFNAHEVRTPAGGFVRAFSTLQPNRAEGHHEKPGANSPMLILVDEAKGIDEGIFDALHRCTPTCLLLASSPGAPHGTFYDAFRRSSALYHTVRVTAFDCPHITPERIRRAQTLYGPNYEAHPIYRSMILGEFSEGEDAAIIPPTLLAAALENQPPARDGDAYAAVDWAAGGDETVLATRRGNTLRILYHDRERDTVRAAAHIVAECRARGIAEDACYGDVCGLGVGIMQAAAAMHAFRMREFNGGSPATDPHYCNLNAQAWYALRTALERGEVCFPLGLDAETRRQLTTRLLDWDTRGRLKCESKEDMARRGLPSPDRADALIMAWYAGRFTTYVDEPPPTPPRRIPPHYRFPNLSYHENYPL